MKEKTKNILSLILSAIMTIFIWHSFLVSGNTVIFIFIYVANYTIIKETLKKANKRNIIISGILAFIFAIIEVLCKSINTDFTLNHVINKWLIVNFMGYSIIGNVLILWIFQIFNKCEFKKKKIINKDVLYFIVCFALILIAWVPYFLRFYPGVVTPDSESQIREVLGKLELSNHHPIFHTGIIAIFIKFGLLISNNINIGVALYSVASMIVMSLFNSCVMLFLRRKNSPLVIRIVILLYYMFYPVNAMYSITMWKDVFFSGIVPIFIIINYKLIFETDNFFNYKRNIVLYILIAIFTCLIRHNGLYVVMLTLPFILIVLRKNWKKVLPMFSGIVVIYLLSNVFIYNILGVQKGSVVEMLSIPVQQIARVEKHYRNELDNETKEEINKFFIVENIGDKYNPILSDDVKWSMNVDYFKKNKIEFIKLWVKLFFKYPKDYVESFISNSYGYYYPETRENIISTAICENELGIEQQPIITSKIFDLLISVTLMRDVPVICITIFSIGTTFWIIVICLGYDILKKNHKMVLLYIPIFVLWLTLIASPVYCEFRYAYPLFTIMPIFISLKCKNKEERNED